VPTDDELENLLRASFDGGPAEPPPDRIAALRARAEAAQGHGSGAPPTSTVTQIASRRGRARPALAVAAGLVALAAGFGAAKVLDRPETSTAGDVEFDGLMVGPDQQESTAELLVVKTGIGRVVDLDTSVLPILPVGDYYEVWFVATDDSSAKPNRISAGTFHPDSKGRSKVQFAAAVDPTKYPAVEITAEPADGNPAATGPVVLYVVIG